MVTVSNVFECLDSFAPIGTKMDFDNVGLLVGKEESEVKKILIALDITDNVIEEAISKTADLIVSHHPLFFSLKSVKYSEPTGRKIINLLENDISAICMHTNLDAAKGGVSFCLAEAVGIKNPDFLVQEGINKNGDIFGLGCCGYIENSIKLEEYLMYVKKQLNANGLRYCPSARDVYKVAVLGGSGGSELDVAVNSGCDTYITADVKYDVFLTASELGINLIDAGHFCTENVVVKKISSILTENFKDIDIEISQTHKQIDSYI